MEAMKGSRAETRERETCTHIRAATEIAKLSISTTVVGL